MIAGTDWSMSVYRFAELIGEPINQYERARYDSISACLMALLLTNHNEWQPNADLREWLWENEQFGALEVIVKIRGIKALTPDLREEIDHILEGEYLIQELEEEVEDGTNGKETK